MLVALEPFLVGEFLARCRDLVLRLDLRGIRPGRFGIPLAGPTAEPAPPPPPPKCERLDEKCEGGGGKKARVANMLLAFEPVASWTYVQGEKATVVQTGTEGACYAFAGHETPADAKDTKKLEAARAIVDRLPLYKTEKTDLTNDPVADDFRQRGADAILFASSSAAESYHAQAGSLAIAPGAKAPLIGSIGEQTTETLVEHGMTPDFVAEKPSLDALIEALAGRLR